MNLYGLSRYILSSTDSHALIRKLQEYRPAVVPFTKGVQHCKFSTKGVLDNNAIDDPIQLGENTNTNANSGEDSISCPTPSTNMNMLAK